MKDYFVTVCSACSRASCWHGNFMCDSAKSAGTVDLQASKLRRLNREHPSHFSRGRLKEVCGSIMEVTP